MLIPYTRHKRHLWRLLYIEFEITHTVWLILNSQCEEGVRVVNNLWYILHADDVSIVGYYGWLLLTVNSDKILDSRLDEEK